jgi:hypothetical protein
MPMSDSRPRVDLGVCPPGARVGAAASHGMRSTDLSRQSAPEGGALDNCRPEIGDAIPGLGAKMPGALLGVREQEHTLLQG